MSPATWIFSRTAAAAHENARCRAGNGRFPRQQSGAAALGPYPNPGRQRPQLAFFSCSNDLVAAALTVWNVCWATFVPSSNSSFVCWLATVSCC